jgi:ubiquitin-conjugating enzyme E2 M
MFSLAKKVKAPSTPSPDQPSKLQRTVSMRSLFLQAEVPELHGDIIPAGCTIHFPNPDDLRSFNITCKVSEGYWKGGTYRFTVNVPINYNMEPPEVHCNTQIWHPNIDTQGHVCLNILRKDWTPVLTLKHVVVGVCELFTTLVNTEDPLNIEAADQLLADPSGFTKKASQWVKQYAC